MQLKKSSSQNCMHKSYAVDWATTAVKSVDVISILRSKVYVRRHNGLQLGLHMHGNGMRIGKYPCSVVILSNLCGYDWNHYTERVTFL